MQPPGTPDITAWMGDGNDREHWDGAPTPQLSPRASQDAPALVVEQEVEAVREAEPGPEPAPEAMAGPLQELARPPQSPSQTFGDDFALVLESPSGPPRHALGASSSAEAQGGAPRDSPTQSATTSVSGVEDWA